MRALLLPLLLALAPSAFVACAPVEEETADDSTAAVSSADLSDIGHPMEGVTNAAVLARNEDALAAKLAVVDGARSGDTLDVSYYIFSDDESSALYATRLVEAAKRGVKVRVMLDYLTNFARYHFFKAMQDAAGGASRMEFRFYNKPNDNITSDVRYLVTPCSLTDKPITDPACTADRRAKSTSAQSEANARLFLTGLYSKSSAALQISMGAVIQQYQAAATGGTTEPEDRAKTLEAFKLVFDAKMKGDVSAMLLVFLAGDKLAPVHNVWSALIPEAGGAHKRDWQHLTDFTHQKITLATHSDGSADMVTGGRNVENSYHLSELPAEREGAWKKKYVFMDMDSKATFRNGAKVRSRFETVWGFGDMVAKMNGEVEKLTPVNLQIPVLENGAPTTSTVPVLAGYTYAGIEAAAARFTKDYATYDGKGALAIKFRGKATDLADSQFPNIEIKDPSAKFYYFDNVHNPTGSRVYGTDMAFGSEKSSGKQIQELWFRAVATACAKGDGDKRAGEKVEIVFHNAYLSLPGRLQHQLFDRTNLYGRGTRFECENGVSQVKIITNSRESTDLNVVNVYNEPWMKPTLEADRQHEDGKRFIQYREYNTNKITARNPISRSLHAKVMIFGNDIFIGSANADGRSQFMDTNNGVLVTNAPKLVQAYKTWLTETVEKDFLDPKEDPRGLRSKTIEQVAKENSDFMTAGLEAKGQSDLVISTAQKRITADTLNVYETAKTCVPAYDKACISNMDQALQIF